jgi:type I restriction enzyme S subunit
MKAIPGEYPLVVLGDERRSHNELQFDTEAVIIPLVSSTGHGHRSMKRIHYQAGKFAVGNILCAVIPKDKNSLSTEFLYRYLDLNKEGELVSRMKGMANVSLPIKSIAEVEIPIPPIQIQKEIIKKFDKVEKSNGAIFSEHIQQLNHLKKLRQQILQDAFQGKLALQDPNDEPASKLLERIIAKKEKLVREKKISKEKPLPEIKSEDMPFEIPESWQWVRMGEISQHNSGKTLDGGRNSGSPRQCLTTSNLYWGYFETDNLKTILIEDEELERCTAKKGDLLICEGGDAGRAAIWYFNTSVCFQNHLHRVRFYENINTSFGYWYFLHLSLSGRIENYRKGMGISNLSGKSLSMIAIPLVPIEEQHRIVTKVEQLMNLCDELEQSIQQNQKYTQELLKVALKEALKYN